MKLGGVLLTRGMTGPASMMIKRAMTFIEDEVRRNGGTVVSRKSRKYYDSVQKRDIDEYTIVAELSQINGKDLFDPIINKVKAQIQDKDVNIIVTPTKLIIKSPDINIQVKLVEK
tara:strand:- start:4 stop:348 length:345 start_codon:yes stop_codon:yes gene_type:complete